MDICASETKHYFNRTMDSQSYKKYTIQAKRSIKGEAFFESLISEYSIPHHVIGPKDLGIDFFCEWTFKDKPTGIFYAVQVKTFSKQYAKPKRQKLNRREDNNGLLKFRVSNRHLIIDKKTLRYWKGLGMPVYLFVVVEDVIAGNERSGLNCFYKRFTPFLTTKSKRKRISFYSSFYKVNDGTSLIAFAKKKEQKLGFARDLYIDYMRSCYCRGSITYLNPRKMGLKQFPDEKDVVFTDLLGEYEKEVITTFKSTKKLLKEAGKGANL